MVIVLPLIASLTFGMVEFAYCFYCTNMLEGAARDGARFAILSGSTSTTVSTAVTNALATTHWPSSYYTVAITDTSGNALNPSTAAVGTQVEVTVSANWGTVGNGFSPLQLMSTSKTITGSCVMRKEQ